MQKVDEAVLHQASRSWREACRRLGIRVTAPYRAVFGDQSVRCLAFLPDFGSPEGMLVAPMTPPRFETDARLVEFARARHLFYSFVNPMAWTKYDEEGFKEALVDWGYFGPPEARPSWLGKPLKKKRHSIGAQKRTARRTQNQNGSKAVGVAMELDVELISQPNAAGHVLLSIGYGNGHAVVQIAGKRTVSDILSFIDRHRAENGSHWMEIGQFGSCPVTLCLTDDSILVVIDSDFSVGGFGQSAGLCIPRDLLDQFVAGLKAASGKSNRL